jgi:hypothetical protein
VSGTVAGGLPRINLTRCPTTLTPLQTAGAGGGIRAGLYALAVAGLELAAEPEPIGWLVLGADFLSGGVLLSPLDLDYYEEAARLGAVTP